MRSGEEASPERGNHHRHQHSNNNNNIKANKKMKQMHQEKIHHRSSSPAANFDEMSRATAKMVILHEVRRMHQSHIKSSADCNRLSDRLIEETARNSQLTNSLQILQQRLTDRERSQSSLRTLLQQRIGEKGLMELMDALEDIGAGRHALLKDTVPLQKPDSLEMEELKEAGTDIAAPEVTTAPSSTPTPTPIPTHFNQKQKLPQTLNVPNAAKPGSVYNPYEYRKAVESGIF